MRVSSGGTKKGAQRHQNKVAFVPNKHSPVALKLSQTPLRHMCTRCMDIVLWKQRLNKYKPLSQPTKCVHCLQKTIVDAYHVVCVPCATKAEICAKCRVDFVYSDKVVEVDYSEQIAQLSERTRRTYLRKIEAGDEEAAKAILEKLLGKEVQEYSDDDEFSD